MTRSLNNLQPWGALFLRLALGCAMVYHGSSKVIPSGGHTIFSTLQHHNHVVASLGLPYWLGYVSSLTEFFGGILILLGFFTRFAAFMIAINMLVALVAVDLRHGYSSSQFPLALLAIALMLLFYGAGAFALDRKIGFS